MGIYGMIPNFFTLKNVWTCFTFAQFFWYIWHANVKLENQYFDKILNIYYWEIKNYDI